MVNDYENCDMSSVSLKFFLVSYEKFELKT